ncbi:MAG: hypothetical protein CVV44_02540 [Spirochaetae bacterium HGW-Spirochaetae-1]|jgi:RNA polymerase sigma factor (sigma-70 family)|nr:MAG: hypothetical protein CVV44_02540 [Spirochaetae bacterium HGW-Spirochaetae-1]
MNMPIYRNNKNFFLFSAVYSFYTIGGTQLNTMLEAKKNREFRKCYSQYYPLVCSVLVSRVGSIDDAEDICQEVFIRFFNHFQDIRDKKKWLMTAVRFEITNYYNKKATARSNADDIDGLSDTVSISDEDTFQDSRIIIKEVLEDRTIYNSEKEKNLFELVAIHNFSFKEAGRYLDMTRWQAEYRYKQVENRVISSLKEKGIREIGDLL